MLCRQPVGGGSRKSSHTLESGFSGNRSGYFFHIHLLPTNVDFKTHLGGRRNYNINVCFSMGDPQCAYLGTPRFSDCEARFGSGLSCLVRCYWQKYSIGLQNPGETLSESRRNFLRPLCNPHAHLIFYDGYITLFWRIDLLVTGGLVGHFPHGLVA